MHLYIIADCFFFKFKIICVLEPPWGWDYTIHLRLIGKRVVDFLVVLIELLLGATAEALRANID